MAKIWSKKRSVNTLVEIAAYWWDDAPDEWHTVAASRPEPPKLGVSVWANNTQEFWQLLHVLACILAQHTPGGPSVEPEIVNEYLRLDLPMRYRKRKQAVEQLYASVERTVRTARRLPDNAQWAGNAGPNEKWEAGDQLYLVDPQTKCIINAGKDQR